MPSTRSSAATKCISEVPGLAKHTSTPPATRVRTRLSAPFITRLSAVVRSNMAATPIVEGCHATAVRTNLLTPRRRAETIHAVHPDEPSINGGKRARRSSYVSHQARPHECLSRQLREVRLRAANAAPRPAGRLHVFRIRRDQHAGAHLGLRGRGRPHEAPRRHAGGSRLASVCEKERRG